MKLRLIGSITVIFVAALCATAARDDTPRWLRDSAVIKLGTYDKDVTAVVLVDDLSVSVSEDGRVVNTYNFAVRILRREGRGYARARVGYIPDSGKVRDFRAWLIRGDGIPKRYGKDETVDMAADDNDVYNEYRLKAISAVDDADAGMIFGYTYITEEHTVFSQDDWTFQSSMPVVNSRYT